MGDGVRAAFGVSGWILVGWAWADEIFGSKKRRPACPDGFSGSKKWHPGCRDWFPSDTKGHPGWADGLAGSAKKHPGTGDDPAMSAKLRPGRGNEFWASAQVRPGTADAFEGAQAARWGQTRPTKRGSRRRREESLTDFRAADGGCRKEWRLVTSSPTRKVAPATCGVRSAECGVRSAECGVRSAECVLCPLREFIGCAYYLRKARGRSQGHCRAIVSLVTLPGTASHPHGLFDSLPINLWRRSVTAYRGIGRAEAGATRRLQSAATNVRGSGPEIAGACGTWVLSLNRGGSERWGQKDERSGAGIFLPPFF